VGPAPRCHFLHHGEDLTAAISMCEQREVVSDSRVMSLVISSIVYKSSIVLNLFVADLFFFDFFF
jgi:hypothetical protein